MIKYIKDLLPQMKSDASLGASADIFVLPSTINADIKAGDTLIIDISGINKFAPCLYNLRVMIADGGTFKMRTSDETKIEGGDYKDGVNTKIINESGFYKILKRDEWSIEVLKMSSL